MTKIISAIALPTLFTLTCGLSIGLNFGLNLAVLAEPVATADPSTLEAGTYFAQGTMYSRSYRVVAKQDDRLCVKIVDGPASPYEGFQEITVTTIEKSADDRWIVAATQDDFVMKGPQEFSIGAGRGGMWQLVPNFKRDLSAGLNDCLAETGNYSKKLRGPFITGMVYPNAPGELISKTPKTKINVRKSPGKEMQTVHYGRSGDKVSILYSGRDQVGLIWYQVKFEKSGVEGWVGNDFVRRTKQ
jgi:hypothetical protein